MIKQTLSNPFVFFKISADLLVNKPANPYKIFEFFPNYSINRSFLSDIISIISVQNFKHLPVHLKKSYLLKIFKISFKKIYGKISFECFNNVCNNSDAASTIK